MRYALHRFIKKGFLNKRNIILPAICLVTVLSVCICLYNNFFPKSGVSILKKKTISDISLNVTKTVDKYLSVNKKQTDKILLPITDKKGNIISYGTDAAGVEKARYEITNCVKETLDQNSVKVKISLGSLSGNEYFTGRGGNITLRGDTICSVTSDIHTEITSIGINQSLYRVTIYISVDCQLFAGGQTESFTVSSKHILTEKLIFGEVPLA